MRTERQPARPTLRPGGALLLGLALLLAAPAHGAQHEPGAPPDAAQDAPATVADGSTPVGERAGTPVAELEPLRQVASRAGLLVGTAMSPAALRRDSVLDAILRREFSSVTPHTEMKWEYVHPAPGEWDFRQADAVVVTAEQEGMAIKGHALVMRRTPEWVERLRGRELAATLEDHVKTLVGRYKGRIRSWDVINELFEDDGRMRASVFLDQLGPRWADHVFRWAHEADPGALLFYNDYGLEPPGPKIDAVHALLARMLDDGVPVHGVGFQAHLDTSVATDLEAMAANMRRFANLGLSVNVSELDVRIATLPGTMEERLAAQARLFADVVRLCGPGSGVDSVTFWGFSDQYSWIGDRNGEDDPHLFDEEHRPKPAWLAVHEAFAELAGQARRATGPQVRPAERRPVRRGR